MAKEDFDIGSLVACLHLSPEQVRKMAEWEKLPGRRLVGQWEFFQWEFFQTEIDRWFEERIGVGDADDAIHLGLLPRMNRLPKISRMFEGCRKSESLADVLPTVKEAEVLLSEEEGRAA